MHFGPHRCLLSFSLLLQLKVVCSLTHDELKPLFQVCKALRSTVGWAGRAGLAVGPPTAEAGMLDLACSRSSRLLPHHVQLRNAVAYHFNYSTPSRLAGGGAPPALGERQRRPARTNHLQVISRLARGGRGMAG